MKRYRNVAVSLTIVLQVLVVTCDRPPEAQASAGAEAANVEGSTWIFDGTDETVRFLQDGSVQFSIRTSGGHWRQQGHSLRFDSNGFTVYEVTIDADSMTGTESQPDRDSNGVVLAPSMGEDHILTSRTYLSMLTSVQTRTGGAGGPAASDLESWIGEYYKSHRLPVDSVEILDRLQTTTYSFVPPRDDITGYLVSARVHLPDGDEQDLEFLSFVPSGAIWPRLAPHGFLTSRGEK